MFRLWHWAQKLSYHAVAAFLGTLSGEEELIPFSSGSSTLAHHAVTFNKELP